MHDGVDEPNPFLVNNPDGEQVEKPKMKRKYALKPEDLAQPGVGLDQLYIQSVIFGNKQGKMKLKGKGHEVNDLEKIMSMYHNWHSELAPKLEFSYFAERLSKMSTKKEVKEHMEKLRGVYRGDTDHFVPFGSEPDNMLNLKDGFDMNPLPEMEQPTPSGAKTTDKNEGIPNFSY